jgi:hypothetical protein
LVGALCALFTTRDSTISTPKTHTITISDIPRHGYDFTFTHSITHSLTTQFLYTTLRTRPLFVHFDTILEASFSPAYTTPIIHQNINIYVVIFVAVLILHPNSHLSLLILVLTLGLFFFLSCLLQHKQAILRFWFLKLLSCIYLPIYLLTYSIYT